MGNRLCCEYRYWNEIESRKNKTQTLALFVGFGLIKLVLPSSKLPWPDGVVRRAEKASAVAQNKHAVGDPEPGDGDIGHGRLEGGRARNLGGWVRCHFYEGLGRWGLETAEELGRAPVSQERSLLKPKPTNRRAASSIRALLEARRMRALLRRAWFFFAHRLRKKKHFFFLKARSPASCAQLVWETELEWCTACLCWCSEWATELQARSSSPAVGNGIAF
jgi:hypothetical protein